MTVITISRQYGSGGDEIADRLCKMMNYHHFDKLTIAKAAADAGLSDQEFIDFSEENYKVKNFFDRLINRPSALGKARIWKEDTAGVRVMEEMILTEEHALLLEQKAVISAYQTGNFVIIGRGGQAILRDYKDVLHLRIEAPWEDRLQYVRAQLKKQKYTPGSQIDWRREAQDLILTRDAASADYLKRFFNIDWADPAHYHLIINTAKVGIDQAVLLISEFVRCTQETKSEGLAENLS